MGNPPVNNQNVGQGMFNSSNTNQQGQNTSNPPNNQTVGQEMFNFTDANQQGQNTSNPPNNQNSGGETFNFLNANQQTQNLNSNATQPTNIMPPSVKFRFAKVFYIRTYSSLRYDFGNQ